VAEELLSSSLEYRCDESGHIAILFVKRDGRIVGILTGGAGPTDETDITYLTPYWWIERQIKSETIQLPFAIRATSMH